jgi:hypothetical protein
MALPKLSNITYELTLPSTGKELKFRPFLVKEEKPLLMAAEDQNVSSITKAMKDIISACTEGDLDIKNLASYDIEYIFLQLRGKSIGDVINLNLKKPDSIECEESECPGSTEIKVNIDDIKIDTSKIVDSKIQLTEDIGIKLGFPQLDSLQKYTTKGKALDAGGVFKMINDCIEYIWEGKEIYKAKDSTKKELNDFIESLNTVQFNKIRDLFESMPRLRHEITWTCTKCDKSAPLLLEGIDSFFCYG